MDKACGSNALCYAMHSHPVLLNGYRFKLMADVRAKIALNKIAYKAIASKAIHTTVRHAANIIGGPASFYQILRFNGAC